MQFKTNLGIALGHNEHFQWNRDGEIQPAIHLLHGLINLDCALRTNYAIEISGDDFVEADFVLNEALTASDAT
jgi:hypothetical protein